ncbi:hypothetical protein TNCV_4881381 [Trichonephila clavipes]|nr:hypothetical protein TNCV_4881381 [Trichonephila clavipes]
MFLNLKSVIFSRYSGLDYSEITVIWSNDILSVSSNNGTIRKRGGLRVENHSEESLDYSHKSLRLIWNDVEALSEASDLDGGGGDVQS